MRSPATCDDANPGRDGQQAVPPPGVRVVQAKVKARSEWQASQWRDWPRVEDWPASLTVYEAAALLRVSPDTIRRILTTDRLGRAALCHTRVGAIYRIKKSDLLKYGAVPSRNAENP